MSPHWFVYVMRCSDGSLYSGVAADIDRELRQLNDGAANAWLKPRLPVFLAYTEEYMNESDAGRRAASIKRMRRDDKERLFGVARES